jgi:hypothetical protein
MIALPKIRLWDEFWHYRFQPDKEAFAEVIRDWPPALIVRLKEVIKLRFGDERYTAPSIMEAMQNLGFWPLDAVTRGVLIALGNADVNSENDLRGRLDKLRRYSFYVLARGSEHDFKCIPSLSAADGAAMIRGLAIAEECGYSEWGGSVSMVNWSFAMFRQNHPLPVWAELADWIIVHTTNPYIPFNFQRTRGQWKACREGSPSPEETWRRVGEAESRRQRERAERIERQSREAQERAVQREAQRRKHREEHGERSHTRSLERLGVCSELERLSPLQRLERICADKSYPLELYPTKFADVNDATIAAMPETLRSALLERLKDRRKGAWRKLLHRLQNCSPTKP